MTENNQSSTGQAQPPAPWLHQPEAGSVPNWALEGPHPGPSWPQPPIDGANGANVADGTPAGTPSGPSPLQSAQASLQSLAVDRPEVIIGAAFAGGIVLALILKHLAR